MSAHCKVCGGLIFDEYGQCYGVCLDDGHWLCYLCEDEIEENLLLMESERDESCYNDPEPHTSIDG
jgi:hypothetical protein